MRKFKHPIVLRQTDKGYEILERVKSTTSNGKFIPAHYRPIDVCRSYEKAMRIRHKMLENTFYPKPKI